MKRTIQMLLLPLLLLLAAPARAQQAEPRPNPSAGGGKITNVKINGTGGNPAKQYLYGIRAATTGTSVLTIASTSIENVKNVGVVVAGLSRISISNVELGMLTPNSQALPIENSDEVTTTGVTMAGPSSSGLAAGLLANVGDVDIGSYSAKGFGGAWQHSGAFSGKLIPGESTTGALSVSSNTITPVFQVSHVGAGLIKNITVPDAKRAQTACFIPDSPFTWDSTGNIAGGGSGAAVAGRTVCFTWSPSASRWYASY